jgi:hypothetical protein
MATDDFLRLIVNGSRRPLDDLPRGLVRQRSRRIAGRTWSAVFDRRALSPRAPDARRVERECPGEVYDIPAWPITRGIGGTVGAPLPAAHAKFRAGGLCASAVSRVSDADVPPIDAQPGRRRHRIVLRRAWPRQTVAAAPTAASRAALGACAAELSLVGHRRVRGRLGGAVRRRWNARRIIGALGATLPARRRRPTAPVVESSCGARFQWRNETLTSSRSTNCLRQRKARRPKQLVDDEVITSDERVEAAQAAASGKGRVSRSSNRARRTSVRRRQSLHGLDGPVRRCRIATDDLSTSGRMRAHVDRTDVRGDGIKACGVCVNHRLQERRRALPPQPARAGTRPDLPRRVTYTGRAW